MSELILIGGGGHCHAAIDVIEAQGVHQVIGILELSTFSRSEVLGYPILGTDKSLSSLSSRGVSALVTIGQIKTSAPRAKAYELATACGIEMPVVVSPRAYVSNRTSLSPGTLVMHRAVINVGAVIGKNCIINSMALIEHDAIIGDHTHIATGAIVNGDTKIGDRCFIGSGATIANGLKIGDDCVIGSGATVMTSLASGSLVKSTSVGVTYA